MSKIRPINPKKGRGLSNMHKYLMCILRHLQQGMVDGSEYGSQLTLSSIWSKKHYFWLKNDPNRLYGGEKLPFISIFRTFWGLFHAPGTQIGFKIGSHISK